MAGLDDGETQAKEVAGKALKCVACGAPYTLRGFANTKSVACEYCGSIFDTSKPEWQLVERVERARQQAALWPLGQRATFEGRPFELVGWMQRAVRASGLEYCWEEHLFFNPYHGYRYLTYQNGHFTLVEPLPGFPDLHGVASQAVYEGQRFRHFSTGNAYVKQVVGEFPWIVRSDETVCVMDFVAPPHVLSSEGSGEEIVWSRGIYMTPDEVVAAVGPTKRSLSWRRGVAPCQPNPSASYRWLWKWGAIAAALWLLTSLYYLGGCQRAQVLTATIPQKTTAGPNVPLGAPTSDAAPLVFPIKLDSRRNPATLEVQASAGVSNSWAFIECALVDEKTAQAYPFGIEVSYYSGYDGGEHWSEGSQSNEIDLGEIPNGDYVLQIERDDQFPGPVQLRVVRDVPLMRYPIVSFLILLAFPMIVLFNSARFETKRWAESDHAS